MSLHLHRSSLLSSLLLLKESGALHDTAAIRSDAIRSGRRERPSCTIQYIDSSTRVSMGAFINQLSCMCIQSYSISIHLFFSLARFLTFRLHLINFLYLSLCAHAQWLCIENSLPQPFPTKLLLCENELWNSSNVLRASRALRGENGGT